MRIGINGLGRIGRALLRTWVKDKQSPLEIVAVNDCANLQNLAYSLEYDSRLGYLDESVSYTTGTHSYLNLGNKDRIRVFNQADIGHKQWQQCDIDLVLECTGQFLTFTQLKRHIADTSEKVTTKRAVLLSHPGLSDSTVSHIGSLQDGYPELLISGLDKLDSSTASSMSPAVYSSGSCTTCCIAPTLAFLMSIAPIEKVSSLTLHAPMLDQPVEDRFPNMDSEGSTTSHNNNKNNTTSQTRAANQAVTVSTKLNYGMERLFPSLKGKIVTQALRIAGLETCGLYVSVLLAQNITKDELLTKLTQWQAQFPNLVRLVPHTAPFTSTDVLGDKHSIVIDPNQLEVLPSQSSNDASLVSITMWFDHEISYAHRMLETAAALTEIW